MIIIRLFKFFPSNSVIKIFILQNVLKLYYLHVNLLYFGLYLNENMKSLTIADIYILN